MRVMRPSQLLLIVPALVACATVRKPAPQAIPKVPAAKASTDADIIDASDLVGRWVFSPGDSNVPEPPAQQASEETSAEPAAAPGTVTSPAGAVLTLGEGGVMLARQGDFIRRGIWKLDGQSLRIIVEPPPRRLEMGLIPSLVGDRLALEGADEMMLIYHREPFIAKGQRP
jgi:hypothetical protein